MCKPEFPTVVALSDVFDPEAFQALALHIALGSLPEELEQDASPEA